MRWSFLFICTVTGWCACTTQSVTPTRNSRATIDSMYQRQTILLQPEMDSVCKIAHKKYFESAVDSIMNARQMEMINLVQ